MKKIAKFFETIGDERGLALVSVLWALSILSLIAAAMMSSSVLSYRMERNDWQRLQMQTLAEFAINRAILGLDDGRPEKRWRIDGVPQDFVIEGAHVRVAIQDERGKIDLNAAGDDQLRQLFLSAGAAADEAEALTHRIVNWRVQNDEKDPENAAEADKAPAKPGFRPRNGQFQSVDELKLVTGMTPALFARVERAITVHSKQALIDQSVAPKEVLLSLPDMDEQKAEAIIATRANPTGPLAGSPSGANSSIISPAIPLNGRVFTITAQVVRGKLHAIEEMVVELTGDPKRPYLILSWK